MIPVPELFRLPAAGFMFLGGLMAWCAGYRLFRAVLTTYGFILGALIGSSMTGTGMPAIFAAIGGGVLGAIVMYFGYFVGVALLGAGVGALLVQVIWNQIGTDPHPGIVIFFCVAGAAMAMAVQRYVIIVVTAFAGTWTLIVSGLAVTPTARQMAGDGRRVWVVYPLDPAPGQRWVLAAWILLGLTGTAIQLRYTGKGKPRVKTAKKER